ncbi:mechanosensitive ion channel family protein [Synechococcus sp. UW69]|uniref:mechanosensitive ion channel family protein n=1 Tax=Synechococcus sp. UW69 TaxID=368493 RepID=UPI00352ADF48
MSEEVLASSHQALHNSALTTAEGMGLGELLIKILIGIAATLVLSFLCRKIFPRFTKRSKTNFDDFVLNALADSIIPFGIVVVLILTQKELGLPINVERAYDTALRLVGTIVLIRFVNRVGARFLTGVARRSGAEDLEHLFQSLLPLLRAVIWGIGTLVLLQSLGVKMTVIWGLLSAGGIGIGLALKEPAQELFAYMMILLDKPFTVGQFISVGSTSATVERIGVRSTHLRSLRGEQVVMSNSTLTGSTILNFAEMAQRRMIYSIGVTYDTTVDQMKSIPTMIQTIIDSQKHSTFNRCHFTEFADSSLNFELVYYIDTRDFTVALNDQQAINLAIMDAFARAGIEFAFPSQTLYLEGDSLTGKAS